MAVPQSRDPVLKPPETPDTPSRTHIAASSVMSGDISMCGDVDALLHRVRSRGRIGKPHSHLGHR